MQWRMGTEAPSGVWWKPVHGAEKVWFGVAFAWCMVLFAMMPLWHWKGGQNPSGIRSTVEPAAFQARVDEFIAEYQVGEENGYAVVEPPPGSDVYLEARMWSWRPILRLQKDTEYTLHLSSLDVNHGFALYPINVNFQVVPGYDYGLKIVPNAAGEFNVVCNEFCGINHHAMVGKVIVYDPAEEDSEVAEGAETAFTAEASENSEDFEAMGSDTEGYADAAGSAGEVNDG